MGFAPVTAVHVVQRPGPLVCPDASGAQVVIAPLQPFGVRPTQQLARPSTIRRNTRRRGSPGTRLAPLPEQPPWLLATQVPWTAPASKATVTQMSPLGHWLSSLHPPQRFGVEKPHVGDPAVVQSVEEVQLPGTQEPDRHTYGFVGVL